ncbi:MAG: hypothetical protein A3B86_02245 [Candidatus Yanofskybacteria bacterium RIFCSPHIGHO2_02_FULL_38_22b]|uniref:HhH-GPD domain-containing protein n=1 Tax=Candidatus Yanofskybacteria bacterium RIFCSPHIGHO2_02_FULL_38_22b TaxID=1802673 RepID=A0A1F8F3C7_9BACT|nr:MAG: hypothetical protein A3B86_02245 [Candidatus Yanofskybacteria bacterium RIFCSPHIGHO2_02_FULL_38_22b]OGN20269.1 MAG: hypothetical protein A2910_03080 [Candidatus Yanofskybacteria bacterium RIFCSPLOWO2_01_FULL_39_28]
MELRDYLKYYPSELESYLFKEVYNNFQRNHCLTGNEFFAIVFWKRKPSGIKIASKWNGQSIEELSKELWLATDRMEKLKKLLGIKGVGIAIASAILTVCYPEEFTVLDYRALNSLMELEKQKCAERKLPSKAENFKPEDYFNYVDICKGVWKKYCSSLREFDRSLWAMDWTEGESGLSEVVEIYKNTSKR